MFLPLRLKTIGDLINPGEKVADVGADHGLLELYLVAKFPSIKIIAIENKEGPFKNLDRNIGALKNVKLSLSDGLKGVNEDIDTVVIAGMGGMNIKNILDESNDKLKKVSKIIIDAHRDQKVARETIVNYGFKIDLEKIIYEEGKFYIITMFTRSEKKEKYSEDELEFGYKIYEDELWEKYKEFILYRNNRTLRLIRNNKFIQDKVLEIKNINERLENYGKN